jgi:flavin reductase (DIM6/NTAB) family NADH-FMN oxidoreductase RutF
MADVIAPRPIALVTTVSAAGVVNMAPFSWFQAAASSPPLLTLAVARPRPDHPKDTAYHAIESGEFTVSVVTEELAGAANLAAGDFPSDVSEVAVTGVETVPSERVAPPRVANSPVAMECRLERHLALAGGSIDFLIGEVLLFHVDEGVLEQGASPETMPLVARMGGRAWCRTRDRFDLDLPPKAWARGMTADCAKGARPPDPE